MTETKEQARARRLSAAAGKWPAIDGVYAPKSTLGRESARREDLRDSFITGAEYEHPIAYRQGLEKAEALLDEADSLLVQNEGEEAVDMWREKYYQYLLLDALDKGGE